MTEIESAEEFSDHIWMAHEYGPDDPATLVEQRDAAIAEQAQREALQELERYFATEYERRKGPYSKPMIDTDTAWLDGLDAAACRLRALASADQPEGERSERDESKDVQLLRQRADRAEAALIDAELRLRKTVELGCAHLNDVENRADRAEAEARALREDVARLQGVIKHRVDDD